LTFIDTECEGCGVRLERLRKETTVVQDGNEVLYEVACLECGCVNIIKRQRTET
jgi:hypothetical protein